VWLILGRSKQSTVGTIRLISQLGQDVAVPVLDGGFLIALEVNPIPFQLVVLSRDDKELERFKIPISSLV